MTRPKCNSCGKDAYAYLIEEDGGRTYMCLDHFPDNDELRSGVRREQARPYKPNESD